MQIVPQLSGVAAGQDDVTHANEPSALSAQAPSPSQALLQTPQFAGEDGSTHAPAHSIWPPTQAPSRGTVTSIIRASETSPGVVPSMSVVASDLNGASIDEFSDIASESSEPPSSEVSTISKLSLRNVGQPAKPKPSPPPDPPRPCCAIDAEREIRHACRGWRRWTIRGDPAISRDVWLPSQRH
jgi:hypothetical protein